MLLVPLIDGEADAQIDAIIYPLSLGGAEVPCLKHDLALFSTVFSLQEA